MLDYSHAGEMNAELDSLSNNSDFCIIFLQKTEAAELILPLMLEHVIVPDTRTNLKTEWSNI